jgi:hypothetical protein
MIRFQPWSLLNARVTTTFTQFLTTPKSKQNVNSSLASSQLLSEIVYQFFLIVNFVLFSQAKNTR